jgi:hypothetical protein
MMRKIVCSIVLMWAAFAPVSGQTVYQDYKNPGMVHHYNYSEPQRKEFIIPGIKGYHAYKADLHTHTVYSDAQVSPEFRVREAWLDGLDVMAITDHMEYRKVEDRMVEYLGKYAKEGAKAVNYNLVRKDQPDDTCGIRVDLNFVVKLCCKAAQEYNLTIIPGIEVTREPKTIGHYNALFTQDNNTIYDADPMQAIKNAKAQGALIMHNHPGWTRTSMDYTEFEAAVYKAGLISGVEVMNGYEFYPVSIERAVKDRMFISSNTDIHRSTSMDYSCNGFARNMTFIFAKNKSLDALKEALEARRTLAYSCDNVAGEEKLLAEFFAASVELSVIGEKKTKNKDDRNKVCITNKTSIPYLLQPKRGNPVWVRPFSSVIIKTRDNKDVVSFDVLNMWCGEDKHPNVKLKF